jgi:Icc-related predicted phosphoesterase
MPRCFFVSDLHGCLPRYEALFAAVRTEHPDGVFLGGDLLPHGAVAAGFVDSVLVPGFESLRNDLGSSYPRIFLILGNDDPRVEEHGVNAAAARGLWDYVHGRRVPWGRFEVAGYAYVPPTPFRLKDWERYDVSRYVDPGCVSPEDGLRTVAVPEHETRIATIRADLADLAGEGDLTRAILVIHTPPYQTALDRAALDGKFVDHVPLDVHVGSIAVRRFIEARQPLLTLHGHVHESARLTGAWRDRLGATHLVSAAHDGPELALVRFDPDDLEAATRALVRAS